MLSVGKKFIADPGAPLGALFSKFWSYDIIQKAMKKPQEVGASCG